MRERAYHKRKAEEYLGTLSREQKLLVISGKEEERLAAGLPRLEAYGEAAHGIQARHDQSFDLGTPVCTTVFQNPVGFAATWDKELMYEIGELVGVEGRSLYDEGQHNAICMLAPTIDMERDPRWGRNEEAYGEDPHLTSRIAGEYIRGMAGDDPRYVRCGATLKHFYGNNVENDRSLSDSNISDELKDSYYIHVFEEVIDYADPLGVMSSYNYVNGTPNTFNPELTTRLKARGLPFVSGDGGVISLAVTKQKEVENVAQSLVRAIRAGMDSFPEDATVIRAGLTEALDSGMLMEEELDRVVLNRLTAYSMLGLLPNDEGVEEVFPKEAYNMSRVDTAEARALARRASAAGMVLLKNEAWRDNPQEGATQDNMEAGAADAQNADLRRALPLAEDAGVLLLGPFADRCPMDWYSGITSHQVTLKEGLGENVTACEALYPYVRIRLGALYAGLDGLRVVPVPKEQAEIFRIMLWDDSRITLRSVSRDRLLTTHRPDQKIINSEIPEKGFNLYANSTEAFSWYVQEAFQMIDKDGQVIHFTEENVLHFWEDERIVGIRNHDGETFAGFETVKTAEELLAEAGSAAESGSAAGAAELGSVAGVAAESRGTTVIASFGLHPIVNGKEEVDRTTIELPPFQRVLLRRIRKMFPKVILVLHTNSPIAIVEEQEAPEIPAILWMATGSEEYGNALADVLYGTVSPAGHLCQTWYRSDDQLPAIDDYDIKKNGTTYIFMKDEPLYRFGFGLSYTEFAQEIVGEKRDSGQVTVRVKNTGARVSDCVVQVYIRPSGDYRLYEEKSEPGCRLTAFTRLRDVAPGEEREVTLDCRY